MLISIKIALSLDIYVKGFCADIDKECPKFGYIFKVIALISIKSVLSLDIYLRLLR